MKSVTILYTVGIQHGEYVHHESSFEAGRSESGEPLPAGYTLGDTVGERLIHVYGGGKSLTIPMASLLKMECVE